VPQSSAERAARAGLSDVPAVASLRTATDTLVCGTIALRARDLNMSEKFPGFKACLSMMRKRNSQTQEDGFHFLRPHAAEYVDELIAEFEMERDHGLRCWLFELLGYARSPKTFFVFVEYLKSDDESFQSWAAKGLHNLNTKDARQALWDARSHTFEDSEKQNDFISCWRT
jgi:hypothetical protein